MGVIILPLVIFHSACVFPVSVTKTILPASRWHLNSLSANGTPGNVMSYASHIPIFPLPTSAPLQTPVKVTLPTKDVDVIFFLEQSLTIEQPHLPLQRAPRPLPADAFGGFLSFGVH